MSDVLFDGRVNKSTGFSEEERKRLHLKGLVPDVVETLEVQLQRIVGQLGEKESALSQYIYLMDLLDRNETLFYYTVMSDPNRFLPIIYDPTIGEACLKYDHIIRQPRGLYLSIDDPDGVKERLENWPERDVRFICVTNGGRILGLGDLGANGMPIPIGKLQLYTAAAGVPPKHLMPIYLDSGTNNEALLKDPFYLGLRKKRPATENLVAFVDRFVEAVQEVFPKCCIHFEDWTGADAVHLLGRYRDKVCCYNDDIQGTAGIALAGLINALKIQKKNMKDQRFLFLGAGSAGIGIANLIVSYLCQEGMGEEEARARIHLFDIKGLIESSRIDLFDFQKPYAHKGASIKKLSDAVRALKPTALIGVSTMGGAFTKEVIEEMDRHVDLPIIFALSNPTDHAECTAEQAYQWTGGRALFAAGVQFDPVTVKGVTFYPSQANNFYIFPAVGLALFATGGKRVIDELFIEAAQGVADQVTAEQLAKGMLYPLQTDIMEAEVVTASRVAKRIFELGLGTVAEPADVERWIRGLLYKPAYK